MLEYEELLTVKPGKGGGYFTRRPTIETAIRVSYPVFVFQRSESG